MTDLAIPTDLEATEARAITDRIRDWVQAGAPDIERAWRGRVWLALGYESWDRYCRDEFGEHIRLPRDERQTVVIQLRETGMSHKAIAAAIGAGYGTVHADVAAPQFRSPERTVGLDGKNYPSRRADSAEAADRITQLRKLAADGVTAATIGEILGVSDRWVYATAHSIGIAVGKRSSLAKAQRIERTRLLAAEGATSQQIADELGVRPGLIRQYARDNDIEILADAMTRVRNMSSARIVTAAIDVLDGIDVMFDHIDYSALQTEDIGGWVTVLDTSIRSLTNLRKRLKEITQP